LDKIQVKPPSDEFVEFKEALTQMERRIQREQKQLEHDR
jgi:hypothetical protein